MVQLLIGRGGAGKSERLFAQMAQSAPHRRQILIVPEQYSHRAERRLCSVGGNLLSLRGEVLTFTRMANRVFAQAGGLAETALDQGGRLLVMYLAVRETQEALTVYRAPSRKPAFLEGLLDTLDECKSYCVRPEALMKAGGDLGGSAGDKLRDLGLILGAYETLCAGLGADPRDLLTRLAQGLSDCDWGAGMDFYLDGFTDFTPQQALVLSQLMKKAHSVTFALTCDHLTEDEGGLGVFSPARRTAAYLRDLARDAGQEVEVQTLTDPWGNKHPALRHMERFLFADAPEPWPETPPVRCVKAIDPRQEVEWTAAEILRLCREEGYRFREIAVTARSLEGYEELIDSVFPRYGIPAFLARTQDILEKPILALITGALDAAEGGYRREDMFRYLKTGLAGITADETDRLENYVLTWDIRGGKWTSPNPWHMHPEGYGRDYTPATEEELAQLDALRRRVIAPLETLRRGKGTTGRDRAIALYDFLEEIQLPQTLETRVGALRARGELGLADEYTQLWGILVGALEGCARLLRDREMDAGEFARLFELVLSQYQVGSIPVALDRVTAGPCPRLGYEGYKAVFFLACDDKHLPDCRRSGGLLTDDDRQALAQLGMSLAPRLEERLHREMTVAYQAVTLPTQALYLTWPAQADGEERAPAFLIPRMERLFPALRVESAAAGPDPRLAAPEPALELVAENAAVRAALEQVPGMADRVERICGAARVERGSLSQAGVDALYGRGASMSASRLDLYRSCHFSDFMRYGLDARPRERMGFAAPEYGTFVHAVLEEVLGKWDPSMDEAAVRAMTAAAVERYLAEELGGLEDKTPRFAYLFGRLRKTVERVVVNATDELRCSDFRPLAFELGFARGGELPPVTLEVDGFTVSLSGFVDRVDGWEHDGKLYLRVMDYKTGRKDFDLTNIFHGIGMQMLLYLFTLEKYGAAYFGKEVVPAGVLYIPARDLLARGERDMDEEHRQSELDRALRRQGLLLDDPAVLEAMENTPDQKRFLPLRVRKDGTISSNDLASLDQLGRLSAHLDQILAQVAGELKAGKVCADPYWRGERENACRFCRYRSACQFEENLGGEHRRWGRHLTAEEFWDALEGGEADGLSTH